MMFYCLIRWPIDKVSKYFFYKDRSNYLHTLFRNLLSVFIGRSACLRIVTVMCFVLDPRAEDGLWLSVSRMLFIGR